MKSLLAALALCASLFFVSCASTPTVPKVNYPVTYQVRVGNSQARTDDGPQNLSVTATQQVTMPVGRPLYYRVVSPFDVTVFVYERSGSTTRRQISQTQGLTFGSSVTSSTEVVEFTFQSSAANTGGTLQFTISDQPIAP